jgi:hypothetical protein
MSNVGILYRQEVEAWRVELSNLCMSLDPIVINIWWKPNKEMKLLRIRLVENLKYSNNVSTSFIRMLTGNVVT